MGNSYVGVCVMLLLKGRQCKDSQRMLIINGVTIHCSESLHDLGHTVSTNNKYNIAKSVKTSFSGAVCFIVPLF